ncbi:MAG: cupin domain-containing protein [Candidatus Omnitrophota bacterium]|nr:cupin domain-containing protein [Candidatus Omnitrophota bacterium]
MKRKILLAILMLTTAAALSARILFAADPLEVAPDMYKLVYQNERVRVMEVTFQPGQSIPEHSHPDHFVYVLEGGQLKITKAEGTVTDAQLNVGDVIWLNAETHSAVNTGTSVVRLLVTELKEPKPIATAMEAAPVAAPVAALESAK